MIFIYALVGLLAGFLGGLLGIGGGLVTVPALFYLFNQQGFPEGSLMHMAIGTTLGGMVFTAASSAFSHYLQRGINGSMFLKLAPGVILGSFLGALFAGWMPSSELQLIFAMSEILIGIYFLISKEGTRHFSLTSLSLFLWGLGIGILSTILGIGGGIITVPLLTFLGLSFRSSIATSALVGFVVAFVGALSFFFLSLHETSGMNYLYFPALIVIGIFSMLAAPLGAKLVYMLPVSTLRRIFGAVLIGVGASLLF